MNTQALLFTAIHLTAGFCALAVAHFYYLPNLQNGATGLLQSYGTEETADKNAPESALQGSRGAVE